MGILPMIVYVRRLKEIKIGVSLGTERALGLEPSLLFLWQELGHMATPRGVWEIWSVVGRQCYYSGGRGRAFDWQLAFSATSYKKVRTK